MPNSTVPANMETTTVKIKRGRKKSAATDNRGQAPIKQKCMRKKKGTEPDSGLEGNTVTTELGGNQCDIGEMVVSTGKQRRRRKGNAGDDPIPRGGQHRTSRSITTDSNPKGLQLDLNSTPPDSPPHLPSIMSPTSNPTTQSALENRKVIPCKCAHPSHTTGKTLPKTILNMDLNELPSEFVGKDLAQRTKHNQGIEDGLLDSTYAPSVLDLVNKTLRSIAFRKNTDPRGISTRIYNTEIPRSIPCKSNNVTLMSHDIDQNTVAQGDSVTFQHGTVPRSPEKPEDVTVKVQARKKPRDSLKQWGGVEARMSCNLHSQNTVFPPACLRDTIFEAEHVLLA